MRRALPFLQPPSGVRSLRWVTLTAGLCVATAMLVWLGYEATRESKRNLRLLLEQRQAEQLSLLWAGLTQDMRAAHATVLVPVTRGQLIVDPPYDLADAFARGFARFSYPESFFAWKDTADQRGITYVFNRADRPPRWQAAERLVGPYPIDVIRDPAALRPLVDEARRQARYGRPFAAFETDVAGVTYQVVVSLMYDAYETYGAYEPRRLSGLVGFTVNLDWVRQAYFNELVNQIAQIGGEPGEVSLEIADDRGRVVTSTRARIPDVPLQERPFPLAFVDRRLLGPTATQPLPVHIWTARAGASQESRLAAAALDRDLAFAIIALAAVATVVGVVMTARGVRVAGELAAMKSDFVSSVTHELKTPLALIRLIADTLCRGRYESPEMIRDYAGVLSRESKELTRLIENLLAYARLSDAKHAYTFDSVEVGDVVHDAMDHFQTLLTERQFVVDVELPPTLHSLRADRSALTLVLHNLIDNAIKYSDGTRELQVRVHETDQGVAITVSDRGIGIRPDEIPRVCDKFFRGRDAKSGGSGLGLAIARQIVDAHGGHLRIESELGRGTRIELVLPAKVA